MTQYLVYDSNGSPMFYANTLEFAVDQAQRCGGYYKEETMTETDEEWKRQPSAYVNDWGGIDYE